MSDPDLVLLAPRRRPDMLDPGERKAASAVMRTVQSRCDVPPGALVLARHAAWPWPEELDHDLARCGACAINPARAYRWADDPREWCAALGELTPPAWDDFARLPPSPTGYILRGAKSDKRRWSRLYARDADAARALALELRNDTGLGLGGGDVPIVARPFVPLERLGVTAGGVPVSTEFRVFVMCGKILGASFYWPEGDVEGDAPTPGAIDPHFLADAIARMDDANAIDLYALDVARTAEGGWIVVEVNDGQRAGLQGLSPEVFYRGVAAQARDLYRVVARDRR